MKKLNVVFMGRGRLGYEVLKFMASSPRLNVLAIINCENTEEVGMTKIDFEKFAKY